MKKLVPLIAALSLAGCGGNGNSTDTTAAADTTLAAASSPTNPNAKLAALTIDVTVGESSGRENVQEVPLGSQVTLNITNPLADDEFHLHGYDLSLGETKAGDTASITFTADTAGEFEVESHVTEEVILTIVVQ